MTPARRAAAPLLAVLTVLLFAAPGTQAAGVGDTAPAFTLADHDGQAVAWPGVAAGRPAVLLFWATWCPYCKAVMPYLDEIRRDYAGDGVQVIAINIKEDGEPRSFAHDTAYDFRWLADGDAVAAAYAVRFTPGLFVVDGDGQIVYRRESTDLPAGRKVAEHWAENTTAALDKALARQDNSTK